MSVAPILGGVGPRRGGPAPLKNNQHWMEPDNAGRDNTERDNAERDEAIARLSATLAKTESRLLALEHFMRVSPSPECLSRVVGELDATPFVDIPGNLHTTNVSGLPAIGFKAGTFGSGADYVDFERAFRGSEERIAGLLARYVPLLAGRDPVLDLGSGRGEVLDLCRDAGITAYGVDIDPDMVEHSRSKGHDVVEGDAIEYLQSLDSGVLGAIVSIQVVEHIAPEEIQSLFREIVRVLRPGGLLIAETINPHSLQAMKTFWVDLTHRHPLFPEVLTVAAGIAGFDEAIVVFPHGTGYLERDRRICTEYALVAQTAAARGEAGLEEKGGTGEHHDGL